jgi:MOSC domain-containing protein YiiM
MGKHLTTAEIETGLAALGASPQDHGTLEMIVCRPQEDARLVLQQGELDCAKGLLGDTWHSRGKANVNAQITLMNSRVIQALAQDRTRWPTAGDQLFVDLDLSEDNLPPGQRLAIGTAVVEVTAVPHTGCAKFTARYGHDAIRFVNSPEGLRQRRRGLNARVVQAGTVGVGDVVTKIGSE